MFNKCCYHTDFNIDDTASVQGNRDPTVLAVDR